MDRLHDGEFCESDRRRLNELLQVGPDRREYFITYMDVQSLLAWEGGRSMGRGPCGADGALGAIGDHESSMSDENWRGAGFQH